MIEIFNNVDTIAGNNIAFFIVNQVTDKI